MTIVKINESDILAEGMAVVNSAGISIKDRKRWKGYKVRYYILSGDNHEDST